jgi:lysine-N-methylase
VVKVRRDIVRSARYMAGFRCLGGACEDTCCAGWTVPIDEPTHRRLRVLAERDPTAQQLLDEGIELTPDSSSFGRLKFGDSGRCGMLDQEGLCAIHARLGPDALFDVCTTYPRYYNEVDAELELFGTLSCPEVARLCLLQEGSLELVRLDDQEPPRKLRNRLDTDQPYYRPFLRVRAALTELLSAPDGTLSEKLFVLLWIGDKLSDVLHARASAVPLDDLSRALSAMLEPPVVRKLCESYRGLALDGSLALSVITSVLGEAQGGDAAAAWSDYAGLREGVPESTRARIDTCLTRYAINHLHTTPYMLEESLLAHVRDLIWRLAALRYLLTRKLSGFEGSADEVDRRLVEVVYRFGRRIEHSALFEQLAQLLERQCFSTFAHTVCFLRL